MPTGSARGNKITGFMNTIRGIQDPIGLFVLGVIFAHHPALNMVYAEGDADGLDAPKMMSVGLHCRLIGRPAIVYSQQASSPSTLSAPLLMPIIMNSAPMMARFFTK